MTREENLKANFIEEALKQMTFSDMVTLHHDTDDYDNMIYPMEDLDEIFCDDKPMDILYRAFYGYDYNRGREENRQSFNPNRDYFTFNGYANLISLTEYEAEEMVRDWLEEQLNYKDWEDLIYDIRQYIDIDYLAYDNPITFYKLWESGDLIDWEILESLVGYLEEKGYKEESEILQGFLEDEESYL